MFDPSAFARTIIDSPANLRKCDLYTLIESCPAEHRATLTDWLDEVRPDLSEDVEYTYQEVSLEDHDAALKARLKGK